MFYICFVFPSVIVHNLLVLSSQYSLAIANSECCTRTSAHAAGLVYVAHQYSELITNSAKVHRVQSEGSVRI